jgi:hypothetical protein
MPSLTLLNLQTPPAPAPEPSSVKVAAPEATTMNCDRPPRPKQNTYEPPQVQFERPKAVGSQLVHPRTYNSAGKASWPEPVPQHGPANFNVSAELNRDLGCLSGETKQPLPGVKVVGSSLVIGPRR